MLSATGRTLRCELLGPADILFVDSAQHNSAGTQTTDPCSVLSSFLAATNPRAK
jgi:hypothetical protein